jgi:hypothetical protein
VPLPDEDRAWLEKQGIAYRESSEGESRYLLFPAWSLPDGKFNATEADILSILPSKYPDAGPDMFYVYPKITLAAGQIANKTNVDQPLLGKTWQRWSRHWDVWRPGIDDIQTVYRRIERALREATP